MKNNISVNSGSITVCSGIKSSANLSNNNLRSLKSFIAFLFFSLSIIQPASAAYEMLSLNARATGFGESYVAISNDANALIFNPAGLGIITMPQISTQYTRLYMGLTDESKISDAALGYVHPFREIGTFGISYFTRSLESIYTENVITVGYGKRISTKTALGLNLKMLGIKTNASSSYLSKTSTNQPSLDIGILSYLNYLTLGLSVSDINQPDISLGSGQANKVPMTVRGGICLEYETFLINTELSNKDEETRVGVGVEGWFASRLLGIRAGMLNGLGDKKLSTLTSGFSLRLKKYFGLGLDYAFIYPLEGIKNTTSHQLSLSLKFGEEKPLNRPKPAPAIGTQKRRIDRLETEEETPTKEEEEEEEEEPTERFDTND